MKKILFCLVLLTGCHSRYLTPEEVEKAIDYCKSNNMEAQALTTIFKPSYPIEASCVDTKNNLYYDVPRK